MTEPTAQTTPDASPNDASGRAARSGRRLTVLALVAALAVAVFLVSGLDGFLKRRAVGAALESTRPAQQAVAEFVAANHRFPDGADVVRIQSSALKIPTGAGEVEAVTLQPSSGAVIVRLKAKGLEGKSVAWIPEPAGAELKWTCGTVDVPDDFLPEGCRAPRSTSTR